MLSVCGMAWAQAPDADVTEGATELPDVEPAMTHIPAGALGFVIINSIDDFTSDIDDFIEEIQLPMPMGPEEFHVLDVARMSLGLGEGFNPKGGLAFVMLDPAQFNVDLLKELRPRPARATAEATTEPPIAESPDEEAEVAEAEGPDGWPFVLMVPGTGITEVFGEMVVEQAGKYTQVRLPMGPMFAAKHQGYILLSPRTDALDAFLTAKDKFQAKADKTELEAITSAGISMRIDMRVFGPVLEQLLTIAQKEMVRSGGWPATGPTTQPAEGLHELLKAYMDGYCDLLQQMDSLAVHFMFTENGLMMQETLVFGSDTPMGKILAAQKPAAKPLLNALPNLPYVMAMGSTWQPSEEANKLYLDWVDRFLRSPRSRP